MPHTPTTLDEAFDRMARTDFELPNGFVNHGPMACEALDALGIPRPHRRRARRFAWSVSEGPGPAAPQWAGGVGMDRGSRRLPPPSRVDRVLQWGDRRRGILEAVVGRWVPRLMPALSTALFHATIRTAQAVRAVDAADTPSRRAELARSLGYWAARFDEGQPAAEPVSGEATDGAVLAAAALGSRHYLARPNIYNLHGVTGAMAVDLLLPHIGPEDGADAVGQVRAEHAAMFGAADPAPPDGHPGLDDADAGRRRTAGTPTR